MATSGVQVITDHDFRVVINEVMILKRKFKLMLKRHYMSRVSGRGPILTQDEVDQLQEWLVQIPEAS